MEEWELKRLDGPEDVAEKRAGSGKEWKKEEFDESLIREQVC